MFSYLSLRPTVEDWRHDLDLSMSPLGIYRIPRLKDDLFEQLKKLRAILSEYQGISANLTYTDMDQPYWYKIEVRVQNSFRFFHCYVKYDVNEDKKLAAQLYCTHRPSTEEFPIEGGVEWRTITLNEAEIKDPAYVVANIKNEFILFESYRQIGRDITYAVMEE